MTVYAGIHGITSADASHFPGHSTVTINSTSGNMAVHLSTYAAAEAVTKAINEDVKASGEKA